ncbi:winged helix-turn-helix domain-containing protein [Enterobacter bugandensis]
MVHIISGQVFFNTQDGTLKLKDTEDVVKLPLPAARLLEVILKNKDRVIERDYLLTEVWDNYGLVSSDSNLNQYISVLRKTLSMMGVEDFIQTIPKIGFKLNDDVVIESSPAYIEKKARFPYLQTSILLITITVASVLFFLEKDKKISEVYIKKVNYNNCSISYLSPYSDSETNKLNVIILDILKKKGEQCNKDEVIYFDSYNSYDPNKLGRIMLSICNKGVNDEPAKCKTYYFNDRK